MPPLATVGLNYLTNSHSLRHLVSVHTTSKHPALCRYSAGRTHLPSSNSRATDDDSRRQTAWLRPPPFRCLDPTVTGAAIRNRCGEKRVEQAVMPTAAESGHGQTPVTGLTVRRGGREPWQFRRGMRDSAVRRVTGMARQTNCARVRIDNRSSALRPIPHHRDDLPLWSTAWSTRIVAGHLSPHPAL